MKNSLRILAVIGAIAVMTTAAACGKSSDSKEEATEASVTAAATAEATKAAPIVTEAPTDPATEAVTEAPADDKTELISNRWNLSEVYIEGVKYQGNYYGSVVKQTGAYIEFHEDDTFQCVLGLTGCKGDYTVENGVITLHLTTKYTGANEGDPIDEYETLVWDQSADTIRFNFNDVTNVFIKY